MKNPVLILLAALVVVASCNNEPKTISDENNSVQVNPLDEFSKLNAFLRKFDEPSQIFKAPSDQLINVKGNQGAIFHINPSNLETEDGQPIGKDVEIELKELTTRQQLLRANAQTVSDGQLLVSGGAYFINITSEGKPLKLKTGKEYSVEFPILSEDEMSLYYGQRDSSGKINWIQGNQNLQNTDRSMDERKEYNAIIITGQGRFADTATVLMKNMSKEENEKIQKQVRISEMVYNPVALNKFGWINCDRFYNTESKRTNITFTLNNKIEDVNYSNVYLIFDDIKSVMQSSYYFHSDTIEGNKFDNVPQGMQVKFLAVSYQHEKIFATLTGEIQIKENHNEKLELHEMNEADFEKLMKEIE